MMNVERDERVVVKGRATIDSRPPFRSVKEAVALFGERVLVGEVYAKLLKERQTKASVDKEQVSTSTATAMPAELQETKEELEKAREEGNHMANCLKSLREELEQTKRELQHLKSTKRPTFEHPKLISPVIEELKIVEINPPMSKRSDQHDVTINDQHILLQNELQKKKFVTFASPPSLSREIISPDVDDVASAARLGRTPSFRKEGKKKPLIPTIGWLFPKKKRSSKEGGAHSPKA
ncbi:hypothetical protein Cgig2_007421 [Carnegiea gigantea]|uniref:Uncharacterized protein n=1 Tax=Carnegiea gigantea TaxID=171969 RepID=A0A9Q1KZV7_9CARY|nr:hypothetical protein Cgig2_007421 [Carnegiea gigantea]